MALKKHRTLKAAYNDILTHPALWKRMGFKELPNYEQLRYFIRAKLEPIIEHVSDKVVEIIVALLKENRQTATPRTRLFENCGEDAVDIQARETDKEAEYSGYYRHSGYKVDIMTDLEHGLPLRGRFIGINANEGEELRRHLELLKGFGSLPEALWVDGKYPTYKNIAMAYIEFNVRLKFRIQKDWTFNEKGTESAIKKRYQSYRKHDSFKSGATLNEMLHFLYKVEDYEYVGAYFRNIQMEHAVDDMDDFMHTYLKRNRCESFNSFLKEHLDLERMVPKGKKKVKFHIALCLLAIQVVALARVQHGITDQIGRHAFLT